MMVDPNDWAPLELLNITVIATLFLVSAGISAWKTFKTRQLVWVVCALMIWGGTAALIYTATTAIDPEMPQPFALCLWVIIFGMLATGVLTVWQRLSRRLV